MRTRVHSRFVIGVAIVAASCATSRSTALLTRPAGAPLGTGTVVAPSDLARAAAASDDATSSVDARWTQPIDPLVAERIALGRVSDIDDSAGARIARLRRIVAVATRLGEPFGPIEGVLDLARTHAIVVERARRAGDPESLRRAIDDTRASLDAIADDARRTGSIEILAELATAVPELAEPVARHAEPVEVRHDGQNSDRFGAVLLPFVSEATKFAWVVNERIRESDYLRAYDPLAAPIGAAPFVRDEADRAFVEGQLDRAASLYARLVELDPFDLHAASRGVLIRWMRRTNRTTSAIPADSSDAFALFDAIERRHGDSEALELARVVVGLERGLVPEAIRVAESLRTNADPEVARLAQAAIDVGRQLVADADELFASPARCASPYSLTLAYAFDPRRMDARAAECAIALELVTVGEEGSYGQNVLVWRFDAAWYARVALPRRATSAVRSRIANCSARSSGESRCTTFDELDATALGREPTIDSVRRFLAVRSGARISVGSDELDRLTADAAPDVDAYFATFEDRWFAIDAGLASNAIGWFLRRGNVVAARRILSVAETGFAGSLCPRAQLDAVEHGARIVANGGSPLSCPAFGPISTASVRRAFGNSRSRLGCGTRPPPPPPNDVVFDAPTHPPTLVDALARSIEIDDPDSLTTLDTVLRRVDVPSVSSSAYLIIADARREAGDETSALAFEARALEACPRCRLPTERSAERAVRDANRRNVVSIALASAERMPDRVFVPYRNGPRTRRCASPAESERVLAALGTTSSWVSCTSPEPIEEEAAPAVTRSAANAPSWRGARWYDAASATRADDGGFGWADVENALCAGDLEVAAFRATRCRSMSSECVDRLELVAADRSRDPDSINAYCQAVNDDDGDLVGPIADDHPDSLLLGHLAIARRVRLDPAAFERLVAATPRNATVRVDVAEAYARIGDRASARRILVEGLVVLPDKPALRSALEYLDRRPP